MNTISARRRVLMQTAGETVIDGSKLEWEVGVIDSSTGVINSSYTTYMSTLDFIEISQKDLVYTGPETDENSNYYIVYVSMYDSSYNFIVRKVLLDGEDHKEYSLYPSCSYIKISFGRAPTTGIDMQISEANLLKIQINEWSKNHIIDVSTTKDDGETVYSVSNNIITIEKWKSTNTNNLAFTMLRPIDLKANDTIRVVVKKKSGTVSGAVYINCVVNSVTVLSNQAWGTGSTALDKSGTPTSDASSSSAYLTFRNRTGSKTYSNYTCSITIYKNGVQVLPEP